MINFYLSTVVIWFIITMCFHILFHKQFIKSRDKLRKETNDNSRIYGITRTIFLYLIISFIPIIRLLTLISFYIFITEPDKVIQEIKEKENLK